MYHQAISVTKGHQKQKQDVFGYSRLIDTLD